MADRREEPTAAVDVESTREPVRGSIKSADRTIQLLELLADSDHTLTFTEIHKLLGVPKSSLSGLLQTLRARGWVETRDRGHTYGIGLRALRVGTEYLDRDPVVAAAAPVLTDLRRTLDETIHLARLDGASVLYLASRETQHHLRVGSRIGRRLPAHATSLGQAMLAARPWEEVDQLLPTELVALTPQTITDRDALRETLDVTRSHGWAREVGQSTPGLICFGMAIPRADGPPTDALSVAIPSARVTPEHEALVVEALATAVLDIARSVRVH